MEKKRLNTGDDHGFCNILLNSYKRHVNILQRNISHLIKTHIFYVENYVHTYINKIYKMPRCSTNTIHNGTYNPYINNGTEKSSIRFRKTKTKLI